MALIQAFVQLLEEEDIKIPAWLSFNSKDGINVVSGDSLLECATIAESCKKVVAVGINCTPPRFISDLILSVKKVLQNSFFLAFFFTNYQVCKQFRISAAHATSIIMPSWIMVLFVFYAQVMAIIISLCWN